MPSAWDMKNCLWSNCIKSTVRPHHGHARWRRELQVNKNSHCTSYRIVVCLILSVSLIHYYAEQAFQILPRLPETCETTKSKICLRALWRELLSLHTIDDCRESMCWDEMKFMRFWDTSKSLKIDSDVLCCMSYLLTTHKKCWASPILVYNRIIFYSDNFCGSDISASVSVSAT